jgi:thymidylate synthase ThyX
MYTEYYGTANLNNILKFVNLRIHDGAQVEIQKVAKAIQQIAKQLYPITVGAYEKTKSN